MIINNRYKLSILICATTWVSAILRCGVVEKPKFTKFYRVKKCHKFNDTIKATGYFSTLKKCANFALEKKGLGFNYSPKKPRRKDNPLTFTNCEILNCPDTSNLTMLVNDTNYDYFTLYGHTESIQTASCVPNIGIFQLFLTPENFTRAQNICRTTGGELADVLTEQRTAGLASVLSLRIVEWLKSAYIGLNDIHEEGTFLTSLDEPLNCYTYRAWAPGQPRPTRNRDDCVILQEDKTWCAINCRKKMPFLCEISPKPPFWVEYQEFNHTECNDMKNRTLKRKCKVVKKAFKKGLKSVKYKGRIRSSRCGENSKSYTYN